MSNPNTGKLETIEIVAAASAGGILVAFAVYWIIQIQGVLEMLEMAYG